MIFGCIGLAKYDLSMIICIRFLNSSFHGRHKKMSIARWNSNSPHNSQSDSLENSFADLSVNDRSQVSNRSEEQDVKMSVAVTEDKPLPAKQRQAHLNHKLDVFLPPEPSVSNHLWLNKLNQMNRLNLYYLPIIISIFLQKAEKLIEVLQENVLLQMKGSATNY